MITESNKTRIAGYIGIADRAGYVIWGVDNLKGYTHKMYLVLYRSDVTKTIEKSLNNIGENIPKIMIETNDFNDILKTDKCKILAIKNAGIAEKIKELLRNDIH